MVLVCPICRSDLNPIDFMGVKLDVCTQCAGIWFDEGELRLLSRESPDSMRKLEAMYVPELEIVNAPTGLKKCPRCQVALDTYRYLYDSPVKIDSCPKCNGVFVEDEELPGIADAIKYEDRVHLTGTMEARARLSGRPVPVIGDRDKDADVSALIHALAHWRDRAPAEA